MSARRVLARERTDRPGVPLGTPGRDRGLAPVMGTQDPALVSVTAHGPGRAVVEGYPGAVSAMVARIREDGRLARPARPPVELPGGRVRVGVELRPADPAAAGSPRGPGLRRLWRPAAAGIGAVGALALVVWLMTIAVVAVIGWVTAAVSWLAVYWGLLVLVPLVVLFVNRSFRAERRPAGTSGTRPVPAAEHTRRPGVSEAPARSLRRRSAARKYSGTAAPGSALNAAAAEAAAPVTPAAVPERSAKAASEAPVTARAAKGKSVAAAAGLDPVTQTWLATLRDPRNRQSRGGMHGYRVYDDIYEPDGSHCATGWLYESIDPNGWRNGGLGHKSRKRMHRKYGKRFLRDIARKNDRRWSLPRIADHVERELRGRENQ